VNEKGEEEGKINAKSPYFVKRTERPNLPSNILADLERIKQ